MKRKYIGFLLTLFIAILLTACSHENKPNQPAELPEYAFIDNIFLIEDNIYATRSAGNSEGGYSYLSTELSDKQVNYRLASLRNGEDNDTLWHDSTKRIYYSEAHCIYSCDSTGNEKEILWELPEGSKNDAVEIIASAKAYNGKIFLLMWAGNTYPKAALCEWNRETGVLLPIVTTDSTFSATGFLIHSDSYYLYDEVKVVSGELK